MNPPQGNQYLQITWLFMSLVRRPGKHATKSAQSLPGLARAYAEDFAHVSAEKTDKDKV